MVLKTVDAALMIPLKKSSAGHLLIDLCDNWLQGGSRIFFHSDISVEEKRVQFADTAYMVREAEGERGRAVFHGDQSMRHQEFHEDQCMSHHVFHGDHNMHAQVCHDDHDLSHQVFHGDSTISQTESRETWNVETCMQLLNEGERGELSRLDESQRDEWLANIFAVRLEDQQNLSSPNPADSAQQGMSLRLLAWLATAPWLTTSDSWCHVVQWQQGQGEEPIFEDQAQGEQGRQIRLVPDLRTRPEGSEMQRSPCARCKLRPSYTPSWGAHALTRKPGALPADVEKQVDELRGLQAEASGQGHRFGRSREELPQPTREDQGAESGLQQGQAGSRSTDRGPYHAMLPGRKGRKTESAEELEAKQREETVDSPGSFTVISS